MTTPSDLPRPAVMAVAMSLAESDGLSVSQRHLRDAEAAVSVARCTIIDGCMFFKGHEEDCSPALLDQVAHRQELVTMLQIVLSTYLQGSNDPIVVLARDTLSKYE